MISARHLRRCIVRVCRNPLYGRIHTCRTRQSIVGIRVSRQGRRALLMCERTQAIDRVEGEVGRCNWVRGSRTLKAGNVGSLIQRIERLSHTF